MFPGAGTCIHSSCCSRRRKVDNSLEEFFAFREHCIISALRKRYELRGVSSSTSSPSSRKRRDERFSVINELALYDNRGYYTLFAVEASPPVAEGNFIRSLYLASLRGCRAGVLQGCISRV